jgi:hypothetical protein
MEPAADLLDVVLARTSDQALDTALRDADAWTATRPAAL